MNENGWFPGEMIPLEGERVVTDTGLRGTYSHGHLHTVLRQMIPWNKVENWKLE